MASLLSAKQVSSLMKSKRRQFVESVVGLGLAPASAAQAAAAAAAGTSVKLSELKARNTQVLVFNVRSLPNRAALSARKQFAEARLQLRKVPNGVVKAAARDTPFVHMMTGPCLIATPMHGAAFTFPELVAVAKEMRSHASISKGLTFSGMVHNGLFLTPKRLDELEPAEVNKVPSLIAQPGVRILQALMMARLPLVATLHTYIAKQAQAGDAEAAKYVAAQQ